MKKAKWHGAGHKPPKARLENAVERAWRLSGREPKVVRGKR